MTETQTHRPVREIVDRLGQMTDQRSLTLRDMIEAFGRASFVPALIVPALFVVSPLSGIPLFSSVCGITIALIALQMVLARDHLWLPDWIMRRPVPPKRLKSAMSTLTRIADWIDRHSRRRLTLLIRGPGAKLVQVLAMSCGAGMPFLEIVPFSSSILGTAVLCFSVSVLARDGLWALAGCIVMSLAALVPFFAWTTIAG